MFAGSQCGGISIAIAFTLIDTTKLNIWEPSMRLLSTYGGFELFGGRHDGVIKIEVHSSKTGIVGRGDYSAVEGKFELDGDNLDQLQRETVGEMVKANVQAFRMNRQ